jgi:hypothetical protein
MRGAGTVLTLLALGCGNADPAPPLPSVPSTTRSADPTSALPSVPPATDPCSEANATEAETSSPLWEALGEWAFADEQEDIPSASEMTAAEAERLLDDAAAHVPGLAGPEAWRSAARYFDAENFHGLTMPACRRADR